MQIREEKISISKVHAGFAVAEYLMILTPREDLWNDIMSIKSSFANKYKHPMASYTKPHLTLLKFVQLEAMENRIVTRFGSICATQPTIKIELHNFGTFPTHTIYINVTSKVPILNLVKALKEAQPLLKYDANLKPYFITEPHITIARRLVPWQHENAWLEYRHSSFTGRFLASKMTLLKRTIGEKSYRTVADFPFRNLPPDSIQGNLFG